MASYSLLCNFFLHDVKSLGSLNEKAEILGNFPICEMKNRVIAQVKKGFFKEKNVLKTEGKQE